MSLQRFDDSCPGCRPALLDLQTGLPLPDDHPAMLKVVALWATTTRAEREAFHHITCLNSRDPVDLALVSPLMGRIQTFFVP